MNIDINLLPEEFLPRPVVTTRTLVLMVIIIALAGTCYLFLNSKSSAESETVRMEKSITAASAEVEAYSSNQELEELTDAVGKLTQTVSSLRAEEGHYESFLDSRVEWGDALERVQARVLTGVTLTGISQVKGGSALVIKGTASRYSPVTGYLRSLDSDLKLSQDGVPSWTSPNFSLSVGVAPGGDV